MKKFIKFLEANNAWENFKREFIKEETQNITKTCVKNEMAENWNQHSRGNTQKRGTITGRT